MAEGSRTLSNRSPSRKRRDRRYDPLKPIGGFRHEPKSFFDRLVHHKWAFPVISVVGGAALILGTILLFLNPNGGSTGRAVRPGEDAVRGGTAPAVIETPGATPAGTPRPTGTPAPQRAYNAAPAFTIDPTAKYSAVIKTDMGDITIALDARSAPQTVNNFVFLAQHRFYDGLTFQRVVKNFVAQAGATSADGSGGPGYTIPDENSPLKHDPGMVAMAQTGTSTNSAGSQFYVALAPLPQQDAKETVFGQVTSGLDILQSLSARDPRDPNAGPALAIQSISIQKQ